IGEKVSAAIDRLPRDTLPPVIAKQDPQSDPILTLLVSGPMSRRELTEIADKQVRRAIQTVDGVGSVDLNGGQGRQIRVLLDAQKLTAHRSEEHTSELQSLTNLLCRLLLENKNT